MSSVIEHTSLDYIKTLEADNKFKAIEELAMVFDKSNICTNINDLTSALKEREEIMSTGIGFGIAIPHAKINSVSKMAFAIGISKKGIDFDSIDMEPVHLIILVAAGEQQHKEYLRLLSNIMSVLKKESIKETIINALEPQDIIDIIKNNS